MIGFQEYIEEFFVSIFHRSGVCKCALRFQIVVAKCKTRVGDNVVFRMGFARTRREARQVVDHKHILVNGKCVNIPSYQVKAGDVIEVKESAKTMQRYKDILEVTAGRLTPEWMDVEKEAFKGTVKQLPTREMIDVPIDEMLIVELYSK